MHISTLNGKKVCILGYGREGQAMLTALEQYAPDSLVTIADNREDIQVLRSKHTKQLGENWLKNLDTFDVIIKSPGIPYNEEILKHKDVLTGSTQIFLDSIKDSGATVIGVTGTKGKSTTSSLIYSILKEAKRDAYLIGNIGEPAISHIADAKERTFFVLELSSYQLSELTVSPKIAVITSFFPDHLDYHGTMESYMDAKKNCTRFQTKEDVVYYAANSDGAKEIAKLSPGTRIPFSSKTTPVSLEHMKLIGTHNEDNIAAAVAVTMSDTCGVDSITALEAIRDFKGLPHRLEYCKEVQGIRWYEDSISTTPESTIAGIDSLNNEIGTIILGGLDRGYDFSSLGRAIADSAISHCILFPDSGTRIQKAIEAAGAKVTFHATSAMKEAVETAASVTPEGMVCLLSPASPSYNLFKDYEDRGNQFKEAIAELA